MSLSPYGADGQKMRSQQEKFSISSIYLPLVVPWYQIHLRSGARVDFLSWPWKNPVSASLQNAGPGGNVSLNWLHIKIQKVAHQEFVQNRLNPLHAFNAPLSWKWMVVGPCLVSLAWNPSIWIKVCTVLCCIEKGSFRTQIHTHNHKTQPKMCPVRGVSQAILATFCHSVCSKV